MMIRWAVVSVSLIPQVWHARDVNTKDTPTPTGRSHPLVDRVRESLRGTLCEKMGMEIVELRPDGGVLTMPIEGNRQPAGLLHGGASIALAESLVSLAAVLHGYDLYGDKATAVGTTYSATHHAPGRHGIVTATGRVLRMGRQVCSYLVEIRDESDRLLCTVMGSAHILPPRD